MYVLGDIHGNYKDLNYLTKNIIQVPRQLCAALGAIFNDARSACGTFPPKGLQYISHPFIVMVVPFQT